MPSPNRRPSARPAPGLEELELALILCRGVLPYLGQSLQGRVHRLFYDSLPLERRYERVDQQNGVFQKRR